MDCEDQRVRVTSKTKMIGSNGQTLEEVIICVLVIQITIRNRRMSTAKDSQKI